MKHLLDAARTLVSLANATRRHKGKSYAEQLMDIVRLRSSPLALGASEYYDLRLFEGERRPDIGNQHNCYIARRMSRNLDLQLNAGHARILANDKIITYALLAALDIPYPAIYATSPKPEDG